MPRILIVGPSWVGDMVMAQSLFRVIKQQNSAAEITVLAPAWSAPVLARMPEVSAHIAMIVGHGKLDISTRRKLGSKIRGQFDQAIVIPNSLKAALVPWFGRIKRRTGFLGEQRYGLLNDRRGLDKEALPLCVQRFVSLGLQAGANPMVLEDIPLPRLVVDQENQLFVCKEFSINVNQSLVALCPGAEFGPAKQWPAVYFAEVARASIVSGRQVVIFGSEKDRPIAEEIVKGAPGCVDLTGRTTLGDAIDLMALAANVVTNDSGLMHIAAAVGCHVIALYGSSSDQFTPPLTDHADRLSLELPCRPCFKRHCPLEHLDCLHKLESQRVIELLQLS